MSLRKFLERASCALPKRDAVLRHPTLLAPAASALSSQRWVSSSSKKGGQSKRKAMQRQKQNQPPDLSSSNVESKPLPPIAQPPKSFATKLSSGDTIQSMDSISSNLLIQFSPLDMNQSRDLSQYWESNKRQLGQPSLSALPDEAADLMEKEALFDPTIHLPYAPQDWKGYEPATPLSDFLMQRIGVSGRPITTAEYMRHALTHPQFGYYTNPPKSNLQKKLDDDIDDEDDWDDEPASTTTTNDSTIIGPQGDFITAPEISHVFGHCLCVWFVTQWKSAVLNQPENIQLVELGPGRGTLMSDILQLATTSKLQDFGKAIRVVNLIEASRELRSQQETALRETLGHMIDFEFVQVSSFGTPHTKTKNEGKESENATSGSNSEGTKKFSIRVEWHDDFRSFQQQRQKDLPVFMVLQEFMDALPVHVFQKTEEGWRERLIDVVSTEDNDGSIVDPTITESSKRPLPRLRQVLAPDVTPAVELFLEANRQYDHAPVGSVIEICPEGLVLAQDMAQVMEESQGVSLIIDYGQDGTGDTLRAFSSHQQVPLTSSPGQVDLTADVDFFALRQTVDQRHSENKTQSTDAEKTTSTVSPERAIHAFGPVSQGEFLMRMGAADMVIHSIEQEDTSPDHAQRLTEALKYLVLPEHMGERFKVLAMAPKREGIFAPPGMES